MDQTTNNISRVSVSLSAMSFCFDARNFIVSVSYLVLLVVIALFVRDSFIRPTLGDLLVVVWLYYALASVVLMPVYALASLVVVIAYLVELGQYLQITSWLAIDSSSLLHVILGATFDWRDLVAYSVGGLVCYWWEGKR